MTIKTFYRPDENMLAMLVSNIAGAVDSLRVVDGHRYIITVNITLSTLVFEALNPEGTMRTKLPIWAGGEEVLEIGVSLSQMTEERFRRLVEQSHQRNFSHYVGLVTSLNNNHKPTKVRGLYTNTDKSYAWLIKRERTEAEKKYAELLKGFDFYYEYRDSFSVYKNAKAKLDVIEAEGFKLGLTLDKMNQIFQEESASS